MPTMRTTTITEDPNRSTITTDTHDNDQRGLIRLWSADLTYLGRWCHDCHQWHMA